MFDDQDRAVSIAVTHVLTIAITTVLISGLLIAAGSMLEGQQDRSAEQSLETVGERIAGEIAGAEQAAGDDGTVTITADHPSRVASERYTVTLHPSDPDEEDEDNVCRGSPLLTGETACLELESTGGVTVYVPAPIGGLDIGEDRSASGGKIVITVDADEGDDGEITLEEGP